MDWQSLAAVGAAVAALTYPLLPYQRLKRDLEVLKIARELHLECSVLELDVEARLAAHGTLPAWIMFNLVLAANVLALGPLAKAIEHGQWLTAVVIGAAALGFLVFTTYRVVIFVRSRRRQAELVRELVAVRRILMEVVAENDASEEVRTFASFVAEKIAERARSRGAQESDLVEPSGVGASST